MKDLQSSRWAIVAIATIACSVPVAAAGETSELLQQLEGYSDREPSLERVNSVSSLTDLLLPTDRALQAERASLEGWVDGLESRVAKLEPFSTTTKLQGDARFAIASVFGSERADGGDLDEIVVFNASARLLFVTSFSGKDLLLTRLDASTIVPFSAGEDDGPNATGTAATRTAFDEGTDGTVDLAKLSYSFPILGEGEEELEEGEEEEEEEEGVEGRLALTIDAVGGEFEENFTNFNEFFAEEVTGAISRFGRLNPIYFQGDEGAGASLAYKLGELAIFSAGYLAPNAFDPGEASGLFNGSYAVMGQLALFPSDNVELGFTYARSFFPGGDEIAVSGETGSELANEPFGEEISTSADHFGFQTSVAIAPNFTIAGWVGLTLAHAEGSGFNEEGDAVADGDDATIFNWAVTFAFPDVGSEGSLVGFIVGQPPRVTDNDGGPEDGEPAWHLEAQYRYQINDNVAINPGIFVVLNPENDTDNDAIWVGTIRTIFEF